jgi:predicted RNase H-like HicB family nuclease
VKLQVTLVQDEDSVWVVECPAIPGCVTQGATRGEALTNIKDAIAGCLAVRSEMKMPLMIETVSIVVAV